MTDPKKQGSQEDFANNPLDTSRRSEAMKDYLPGGKKYLCGVTHNPRQGMGIPQWLHEWDSKWNRITREGDKHGKPKL